MTTCPACGGGSPVPFYEVDQVPVNSCLLVDTEAAALAFPRGDLRLSCCPGCGFVHNTAFDPSLTSYSPAYEETQAFSPRFGDFIGKLAHDWVDRYELRDKHVVEIGCGKGEFLVAMMQASVGSAVGIDPGVHPERVPAGMGARIDWVQGFFPADYPRLDADAVICRHTLEHIAPVATFMRQVRAAIGERTDTVVLFELPDTARVFGESAFWDVYYEHCSYFTAGSLARLFRRTGFDVLDVRRAYDDQYLLLEARPSPDGLVDPQPLPIEDDLAQVAHGAERFRHSVDELVGRWRTELVAVAEAGGRAVLWGAGSKSVAFLAALGRDARSAVAAVDINPHKHGMYLAGTGHRIIAPDEVGAVAPDLVLCMNVVYLPEIGDDLRRHGVTTRLESL